MYKIIDRQGTGMKADRRFKTKEDVRKHLVDFHSVDVELTGKETLEDMLDIGDWELEAECNK